MKKRIPILPIYLIATSTLLVFGIVKYLLIPKNEDYEVFSYLVTSGILCYSITFSIIYLIGRILNINSIGLFILSFILIEVNMLFMAKICLLISLLIFLKNYTEIYVFTLYHGISATAITVVLIFPAIRNSLKSKPAVDRE